MQSFLIQHIQMPVSRSCCSLSIQSSYLDWDFNVLAGIQLLVAAEIHILSKAWDNVWVEGLDESQLSLNWNGRTEM
jgi:hypothetical protein